MAADIYILQVWLGDVRVGTITRTAGDDVSFSFEPDYVDNEVRPVLSLSYKNERGGVMQGPWTSRTQAPAYFSNLLPEGRLRDYLARKAGVNPRREFFLLWLLGQDLPGAVVIRPEDAGSLPPIDKEDGGRERETDKILRFSLQGVQLKFSALKSKAGGLSVPAKGIGGDYIIKLPSTQYPSVPENEYTMMELARACGIDVPECLLVPVDDIGGLPDDVAINGKLAYAVKRFDRPEGPRVHFEDFMQVFGKLNNNENKYRQVSYRDIADVLWVETGEEGVCEFVRRIVFNILIGNADMHAKNWAVIYPDGRNAVIAPAYDFVSTIPYLKDDKDLGLSLVGNRNMDAVNLAAFERLADRAGLPKTLIVKTALDAAERTRDEWATKKKDYPLPDDLKRAIDSHIDKMPIGRH